MNWLITGGAGYIGSHIAELFQQEGLSYYCYDNLSTGDPARISDHERLIVGDIHDELKLSSLIKELNISGVIHLAAKKSVEESREKPILYEETNFKATERILQICSKSNVSRFIFSSTAAVYGESKSGFVSENAELHPISTYGVTKLKAEDALNSYIARELIQGVSLRYFNVIGQASAALKDNSIDNLVPRVLTAARQDLKPQIYGNDYPTPDRTCIRDYVDVRDIARLHLMLCRDFDASKLPMALNVGTGVGVSVLEVMQSIYSRMGLPLDPEFLPRRDGDPATLVAEIGKMREEVGFFTKFDFKSSLESLLK
jgi:UDP-glucose 4-epimerase